MPISKFLTYFLSRFAVVGPPNVEQGYRTLKKLIEHDGKKNQESG